MRKTITLAALVASISMNAQVAPKVLPETPVNGKSYILVNKAQSAEQYTSRTTWDGALYFLGEEASHYLDYALTAIDNGNGTWSFSIPKISTDEFGNTTELPYYMVIPEGSPNVNVNADEPVEWKLDKKDNGFYNIIAGAGNNYSLFQSAEMTPTKDIRIHLNNGGQYFVATYYGNSWFPDCMGGVTQTDDEATGNLYFEANDSTSFCWGFVSPERIDSYYQDLQAVATINNFYNKYKDLEGFSEGFLKSYNACADMYTSSEYNEEDIPVIKSMISNKIAFYNEIEKAASLNESDDPALAMAITKAVEAFATAVSPAELESAISALQDAEKAYSEGTGDITAYGTNMSFEDLSAQGGNQSSSVAGAPVGWNVYINGKQAITASDVSSSGISAWHGVNNDAEGEIMDGAMIFGIWNGSIPTYELSQTISGLENGTYEITAGLMAGSNGNGSRLTTQRIFGNLNSTYYGSDFDYNIDLLDNSEVFDFACNEIISTDREMRPVTVNAFVYDGTLTFGVRTDGNYAAANRDGGNGAGGDGWFKTDNFKIVNKGYIAEDAVAIYNHYQNIISQFEGLQMAKKVQEQIEAATLGEITVDNSQDEIIGAILNAKELVVVAGASVKAYDKLFNAIELHYGYVDQYQKKTGIGEYADVVDEAYAAYEDMTAEDEAAVDSIIAALNEALKACIQSDDIEEGADLTEYIQNPSFEDLSSQNNNNSDGVANPPVGWNIYVEGNKCETSSDLNKNGVNNWCAINRGDNLNDVYNTQGDPVYNQYTDGDHLWGIWSGAVPVLELSQTIEGLPAGAYTLTADIVVQNDWAGMNLGMQRLFANDYVTMYGAEEDYIQTWDDESHASFPEDVLIAEAIDKNLEGTEGYTLKHLNFAGNYSPENYGASSAPYTTTVQFGLPTKGDVTFGVRTSRISATDGLLSGQASLGWLKVDNFHLTYESFEVPIGADANGESTSVENIKNNEKVAVGFYSINGTRLAAPQKGINIVKMSNGAVSKVLVK